MLSTIVKKFQSDYATHLIVCVPDGKHYENWYSVFYRDRVPVPTCTAGLFDTLEEAVSMMHKHRPTAKEA
jgi:hypothetical protein